MKRLILAVLAVFVFMGAAFAADKKEQAQEFAEYALGIDDVVDIHVLQPEKLGVTVTVSPDGSVNFPYIGMVRARGLTLTQLQEEIRRRLSDGYMKYPVVSVSLRETRSKKFFVYGEVLKPGTYLLDENTTVIKAISMAGGFTKFGSSSRVRVLRPKPDDAGYDSMRVNIGAAMSGDSKADVVLRSGDIVVVSEGVF